MANTSIETILTNVEYYILYGPLATDPEKEQTEPMPLTDESWGYGD